MTINGSLRRGKPRWLVIFVVVSMLTAFSASIAQANLAPSTFEGNDGNQIVNTPGNTDWANVAGKHTATDKSNDKTDNSFGQGTKEDNSAVTIVSGAIPPNKNDLTGFLEASETIGANTYLYLAWTRAVNIGNANMDFEINASPTAGFDSTTTGKITLNRTLNDLLITYDFGGSGTPTLGYRTWNGSAWSGSTALTSANSEGAVSADGLFGEASINLTGSGIFPAGTCESLGSTFLKSRSSSSFTAEIKDFVAPVAVRVSNCGTVVIHKTTSPTGGTGFPFTSTITGNTSFSLDDAGTKTILNVQPGSYNVTETVASIGNYTLTGIDCSAGDLAPTSTSTATGATAFTMAAGKTLECTYTNTLNKTDTSVDTTPSGTATWSATLDDSATMTPSTATGSVVFNLWQDDQCTVPQWVSDSVGLVGGTASSASAGDASGTRTITNVNTTDADGVYYWTVDYTATGAFNDSSSNCGEQISITPASVN